MVITTWFPNGAMAEFMEKVELVHKDYRPQCIFYYAADGSVSRKVFYSKYTTIENLDGLHCLTELWLSSNLISTIDNLKGLKNLKKLGLAQNRIRKIEGLKYLQNLEFLDLQANRIDKL